MADRIDITLSVPSNRRYQLVYRQERSERFAAEMPEGVEFRFLSAPVDLLARFGPAWRLFGLAGAAKACLKLATPSRSLYCLMLHGAIVNYGWVMLSSCGYYRVERGDAVIGPVWTDPSHRGEGLATLGLRSAINAWLGRGSRVFFIDTAGDNLAMQAVIAKCGFGPPVALYLR